MYLALIWLPLHIRAVISISRLPITGMGITHHYPLPNYIHGSVIYPTDFNFPPAIAFRLVFVCAYT